MRTAYILTLLLGFILTPCVAQALDPSEADAMLAEATTLFQQASEVREQDPAAAHNKYEQALLRYEALHNAGIENGRLFYNIGNTYLRLGEYGEAILSYRRAEHYIPHDPNLRRNLAIALERAEIESPESAHSPFMNILLFWHTDLPTRTRLFLFAGCWTIFWLCAMAKIHPRTRRMAPWALLVCTGLFSLALLGSLGQEAMARRGTRAGVILVPDTIARSGDGAGYAPAFKAPLREGESFDLLQQRGKWLEIRLPDARTGWIRSESAGLVRTGSVE